MWWGMTVVFHDVVWENRCTVLGGGLSHHAAAADTAWFELLSQPARVSRLVRRRRTTYSSFCSCAGGKLTRLRAAAPIVATPTRKSPDIARTPGPGRFD